MTAPYRTRTASGTHSLLWRRILLLAALAALLAVPFLVSLPKPPATLAPALVLSGIERAGNVSVGRDCGYSAPLPANPRRSFWLFCDTPVYVRPRAAGGWGSWVLRRFITGSTAAEGLAVVGSGPASRVPGQLSEVASPLGAGAASGGALAPGDTPALPGAPVPFLASPVGLVTSSGLPCGGGDGTYAASWATGLTRVPASPDLLIAFDNYCVLSGNRGYLPEGFGLAEYDPATGTLSNDAIVFSGANLGAAAAAKLLGSPVFSGRYLYLFGPTCTALAHGGCATGTLYEARVPATPLAWADPLSYRWLSRRAPGLWTPDPAAATSIIASARPSAVSVAYVPAGRHFILVEQTDIGGGFTVYGSPAPAGSWNRITSGRVPCRPGTGYLNFCRAIILHPELSTPTQLVLSFFDPGAGAHGHVMVAGFGW